MRLHWFGIFLVCGCFVGGCLATPITLPGDEDGGIQGKRDFSAAADAGTDMYAADTGTVGSPDAPGHLPDGGPAMDAMADIFAPDTEVEGGPGEGGPGEGGPGEGGPGEGGVIEGGPGEGGVIEGGPGEGGPGEGGVPPADLSHSH